jgi:hypothetical protein
MRFLLDSAGWAIGRTDDCGSGALLERRLVRRRCCAVVFRPGDRAHKVGRGDVMIAWPEGPGIWVENKSALKARKIALRWRCAGHVHNQTRRLFVPCSPLTTLVACSAIASPPISSTPSFAISQQRAPAEVRHQPVSMHHSPAPPFRLTRALILRQPHIARTDE